jgi:hypothetical protein
LSPQNKLSDVNKTYICISNEQKFHFNTISYFSTGNQKDLFLSIVEEARTEALLQTEGKTVTYVSPNSGLNDWVQFGKPKDKRSLNSVILRKDAKENIVSDAEEFIANSKWYRDREIPYRRGYLLHGPPGMNSRVHSRFEFEDGHSNNYDHKKGS